MEENNNSPFQFINDENNIIPIEEEKKIDINQPTNIEVKSDAKSTEDFVTGLPEWDLVPPYEIVRRVIRK